jgi:hypothetical protein
MPAAPPKPPLLEALVVDRDRMVRMLRIGLKELHDRRLQSPNLTGDSNVVELIQYWDNVFEWIKQLPEGEVVVMSRRES